ncbi:Polyprotein [Arachis hypogaea]|nr:Polyprotein [Arachis hypogaea]
MKEGSIPTALIYRIQYKVMNTYNSRVLLKTTNRKTILFVIDMKKANVTIPRLIKWDEIDLLESWAIEELYLPCLDRPPNYKKLNKMKLEVEIFFSRRNCFFSRSEAASTYRSNFASARRSFSIRSHSSFPNPYIRIINPEINLTGLQTNCSIPRPIY